MAPTGGEWLVNDDDGAGAMYMLYEDGAPVAVIGLDMAAAVAAAATAAAEEEEEDDIGGGCSHPRNAGDVINNSSCSEDDTDSPEDVSRRFLSCRFIRLFSFSSTRIWYW